MLKSLAWYVLILIPSKVVSADRQMHVNLTSRSKTAVPTGIAADLRPRLVTGLKGVGVMTAKYCKGKEETISHKGAYRSSVVMQRVIE